jgi:zinc protease
MSSEPPQESVARRTARWPGAALCCGALWLPALATAAAQPAPMSFAVAGEVIRTHTLANGLQVIVWPDHRVPSVALFNWVHVGSRNEGTGPPARAFLRAHDVQGHDAPSRGRIDRLLEANGAQQCLDLRRTSPSTRTGFRVPRSNWCSTWRATGSPTCRFRAAERGEGSARWCIPERRLRIEDSNPAFLDEQVQATAFLAHPYRSRPSAGPRHQVLDAWMTCRASIIAGTRRTTARWCWSAMSIRNRSSRWRENYGPIPRGPAAQPVRTVEPEQTGERASRSNARPEPAGADRPLARRLGGTIRAHRP